MNPNIKLLAQLLISTEIIGLLVWLVYMTVNQPSLTPEARQVLDTVVANIVPLASATVGFWLGTSLSSAAKDQTISEITKGAP